MKHGIDCALVAHVHDEWQIEIIEEEAEAAAALAPEAITGAGQLFELAVRLDGESKVGKTWAETH